jgi:hypothetical protein
MGETAREQAYVDVCVREWIIMQELAASID